MMIVAIYLDREGEKRIMDVMLWQQREYKFYCSGTIESIAQIYGINCAGCHEVFQLPPLSGMSTDSFIIFALESKAETLEFLCKLTETGFTQVQTSENIQTFINSRQPLCFQCRPEEDQDSINDSFLDNSPSTQLLKVKTDFVAVSSNERSVSAENNSSEKDLEVSKNVVHRLLDDIDATPAADSSLVYTQQSDLAEPVTPSNVHEASAVNPPCNNRVIEVKKEANPVREEQCQVCKKILAVGQCTFRMPSGLQQHARIHIFRMPFTCQICNYQCRSKQSMNLHFGSHHVGKKKAFTDMSYHADYIGEVIAKAKECFPDWDVPLSHERRPNARTRKLPLP